MTERIEDRTSTLRGTSIVSGLNIVSRFLGFIRDMITAQLFGASLIADAFFVAFRIPNLLRSFVAEGAMTSAFVPLFSTELKRGHTEAQHALSHVCGFLLVATTLMTIAGIFFAPQIVHLFAPGFGTDTEQSTLCVLLTRIMLPYIVCISIVAMLNGALNTMHIFGAAAMAQCVLNLALIAGGFLAYLFQPLGAVKVLAVSVIVGGILQILIQIPALNRAKLSLRPSFRLGHAATKELLRLMLPAIVGATVYQISIFVNTLLATVLVTGSVSWLFYADRVVQFPIGIFSISLASVLLPALSSARAENDSSKFAHELVNALRYTSFFIIPGSAVLCYFAQPIVSVLFERGAFGADSTLRTASAIQALGIGIWAVSCHSMIVRAFLATKDTVTPTIVGACTLLISLFSAVLLMGPPQTVESGALVDTIVAIQRALAGVLPTASLQHVGLALASSLGSFFSCAALYCLLRRKVPAINWQSFYVATAKSLLATLCMVASLHFVLSAQVSAYLTLAMGMPLGLVVYLGVSFATRNRELGESAALLRRILKRDKKLPLS